MGLFELSIIFKTYSMKNNIPGDCARAVLRGYPVFILECEPFQSDVIIAEVGETEDDVKKIVCLYYGLTSWPTNWNISRFNKS